MKHSGHTLKQGRSVLDTRRNFFTVRTVKLRNELPKERMRSPSSKAFKTSRDKALRHLAFAEERRSAKQRPPATVRGFLTEQVARLSCQHLSRHLHPPAQQRVCTEERLARHLQKEAQSQHNNSEFTEDQKKTIAKIATCLELRSAALQSTQSQDEFKLEDLKKLEPILKNILTYNKEFPFDVQPVPLRKILAPGEEEHLEFEEDDEEGGAGAGSPDSFPARVPGANEGTLLPRLPSEPGMTLLTINIEKIGLKDAGQCIDPYITVSVKDLNGIDLTPVQDTPVALRKEDTYVHFNVDIEIQKHVEKLTKGAAIFFEFKHYKPKKRFTSTKCFAFMEMDEIKPGAIVIELYKKPTDFKRKKLQLLTKKPLYLHLHQTLHKE
ncbi:PREDICTED: axin interactor, dorsalization-associated protein [Aptenodytes forsteri]|uniref:axin interactor, dorsalization-associated protein n=1 Tax=Aptenodytes forsteri TaxID=9233 RepID=UPI0004F421B4|nr:PREDICTED: axin interactor, dorsalization-associated protein [Aptenodytes forsteri]